QPLPRRSARHPLSRRPFPTRRSSDLLEPGGREGRGPPARLLWLHVRLGGEPAAEASPAFPDGSGPGAAVRPDPADASPGLAPPRSEEHTSELQSLRHLVCRLLLEKTK